MHRRKFIKIGGATITVVSLFSSPIVTYGLQEKPIPFLLEDFLSSETIKLSELDKKTINEANLLIGKELGRTGIGRLKLRDWLSIENPRWSNYLGGGWHHMGITRMHTDPKKGVVDENCKVHDLSNLYVAGSSVFPTAGTANPTLTIVALSLRLADHLKTFN